MFCQEMLPKLVKESFHDLLIVGNLIPSFLFVILDAPLYSSKVLELLHVLTCLAVFYVAGWVPHDAAGKDVASVAQVRPVFGCNDALFAYDIMIIRFYSRQRCLNTSSCSREQSTPILVPQHHHYAMTAA